jgi:surface antigen
MPLPYPCLGNTPNSGCRYTPTYPARECTSGVSWWASRYMGKAFWLNWGDAYRWPAAARAAGLSLSVLPTPNSIMCVPPNVNNAGPKGHVAFVTGIAVGGMVDVIEVNWKPEYGSDTRPAPIVGCEFIRLPAPTPPPPPIHHILGDEPMLYFRNDGSIFLLSGGVLIALGSGPDSVYLTGRGVPSFNEKNISPAFAATLRKLPFVQ